MQDRIKKFITQLHQKPILTLYEIGVVVSFLIAIFLGFMSGIGVGTTLSITEIARNFGYIVTYGFAFVFFVGPVLFFCVILPILNTINLLKPYKKLESFSYNMVLQRLSLLLFSPIFFLQLSFLASPQKDWPIQLINDDVHNPIYSKALPLVVTVAILSIVAYVYLSFVKLEKTSPIKIILSFSMMLLGLIQSVILIYQLSPRLAPYQYGTFILFPLNFIIISLSLFRIIVSQWNQKQSRLNKVYSNPLLQKINLILSSTKSWPIAILIFSLPLLAVGVGILVLFGQSPALIIKTWTETSEWSLSEQVSPQNVFQDEHYLCTVAAGGHKKIVKPIRYGVRHGHIVVVNRQLSIANAFEQVIEEKAPRFHKVVRFVYDRYGFPLARLVKSKTSADIVYVLMKPLEWFFLIILYFTDANPENRIALQYFPKKFEVSRSYETYDEK
ncbi:DUF6688 domain-containing protein [Granulicatella seriolae]|uniref:ABC transporter permease n=1 Tax=Granulicatella seriolae TaxID=2967226 RepID=A0ABT1WN21_9LACT|nr:DUF6688 family protein [Granulicatella seriolae]